MKMRTIGNKIIFKFEDELSVEKGIKQFRNKTNWGFDLRTNFDDNVKSARWGIVVAYGPECTEEIKQGLRVLIEPLKWTEGMEPERGEFYWMTKEDHILAVDDQ